MTPEKLGASQFSSNDSAVALRGILDSTKKETLGDVIQTVKVSSDELTLMQRKEVFQSRNAIKANNDSVALIVSDDVDNMVAVL